MQLLDAVDTLHSKGQVAHLDLKLDNILIDNDYQLKICDFGFADDLRNLIKSNKGTVGYKAPEIQLHHKAGFQGRSADIFALGVILFIIEFGVPPFSEASKQNSLYRFFYRGNQGSR